MTSNSRSFQIIKTSTAKDKIKQLKKLEEELKASPMKSVWEASAAMADVVPKAPTTQYLQVIELLAAEYSTKTGAVEDKNYNLAVLEYKKGINLAFETNSHASNGRLRIAMAALIFRWMPCGPPRTQRVREVLQWVLEKDDLDHRLLDKANKMLQGEDRAVVAEVVAAMNQVDGYDYGGGWNSHWYECRNGHPYFIGECGQAMQRSTCLECGETIGGGSHSLHHSNRRASGVVGDVLTEGTS